MARRTTVSKAVGLTLIFVGVVGLLGLFTIPLGLIVEILFIGGGIVLYWRK